MKLKEKVMLITGGSGALGQTVVPAFIAEGARVFLVSDKPDTAEGAVSSTQADVTDEAQVKSVVSQVIRNAGRIDGLINLVGTFAPGHVSETEITLWRKMLDINLTSAFLLSKAIIPHMRERRMGRILHIAAWAAAVPFAGAAAYIVSKSALLTLVRVLALELSGTGVTVNTVLPTTIDTPGNRASMPNADRSMWASPEAIAETLIFLASEEARQISGASIPIGTRGGRTT